MVIDFKAIEGFWQKIT